MVEAPDIMLFLKSVEAIEVYEWLPGSQQPTCLYSCAVMDPSQHLRQERALFVRASSEGSGVMQSAQQQHQPPVGSTFTLDLQQT